jgi:hypothetical protein
VSSKIEEMLHMNNNTDTDPASLMFEAIGAIPTKSDKLSFARKSRNMRELLDKLEPIETQILELVQSKTPIIDQITKLRSQMVATCVHPLQYLVLKDQNTAQCKFCDKLFRINNEPT